MKRLLCALAALLVATFLGDPVRAGSLTLLGVGSPGAATGGYAAPFVILADNAGSATAGTSEAFTTTGANCPAGATVVFISYWGAGGFGWWGANPVLTGGGLTWTQQAGFGSPPFEATIYTATATGGLPASSTLTLTWSGGTAGTSPSQAVCFPGGAGGVSTGDNSNHYASGYGTAPAITTPDTTYAGPLWELAMVEQLHNVGSNITSPGSGYTLLSAAQLTGGALGNSGYSGVSMNLILTPATGGTSTLSTAPGYTMTLSAADNWYTGDIYVASH